jgi:hypothetical protein
MSPLVPRSLASSWSSADESCQNSAVITVINDAVKFRRLACHSHCQLFLQPDNDHPLVFFKLLIKLKVVAD